MLSPSNGSMSWY